MTTRLVRVGLALGGCALACLGACAPTRTVAITSEPAGATVTLNGVEVGRTPTTADFAYYGIYDVTLRLDGFEPLVTTAQAHAPIYEYPPLDLAALAVPGGVRTSVRWHFVLEPLPERTLPQAQFEQELLGRAAALRSQLDTPPPAP